MPTILERLLGRLTTVLSTTAVISSIPHSAEAMIAPAPTTSSGSDTEITKSYTGPIAKLIFGRVKAGSPVLARHGSHSSHSSHASHASHYSGAGSTTTPPKPSENTNAQPRVVEVIPRVSAPVLAKLPNVRSRWPSKVKLKAKTNFNIYEGDRVIAIRSYDAGTVFPLAEVTSAHVLVYINGAKSPLPVEQCDLVENMGGESAILAMPDDRVPEKPVAVEKPEKEKSNSAVPRTPGTRDETVIISKLLALKSRWPKEVTLREKCDFPIFEGGKFLGNRSEEAGTVLRVVSVERQGVLLLSANSPSVVRLDQTDLLDRMGGADAVMAMTDDSAEGSNKSTAGTPKM